MITRGLTFGSKDSKVQIKLRVEVVEGLTNVRFGGAPTSLRAASIGRFRNAHLGRLPAGLLLDSKRMEADFASRIAMSLRSAFTKPMSAAKPVYMLLAGAWPTMAVGAGIACAMGGPSHLRRQEVA